MTEPRTITIEPLEARCWDCCREFAYRPSLGQRSHYPEFPDSPWLCDSCYDWRIQHPE